MQKAFFGPYGIWHQPFHTATTLLTSPQVDCLCICCFVNSERTILFTSLTWLNQAKPGTSHYQFLLTFAEPQLLSLSSHLHFTFISILIIQWNKLGANLTFLTHKITNLLFVLAIYSLYVVKLIFRFSFTSLRMNSIHVYSLNKMLDITPVNVTLPESCKI